MVSNNKALFLVDEILGLFSKIHKNYLAYDASDSVIGFGVGNDRFFYDLHPCLRDNAWRPSLCFRSAFELHLRCGLERIQNGVCSCSSCDLLCDTVFAELLSKVGVWP